MTWLHLIAGSRPDLVDAIYKCEKARITGENIGDTLDQGIALAYMTTGPQVMRAVFVKLVKQYAEARVGYDDTLRRECLDLAELEATVTMMSALAERLDTTIAWSMKTTAAACSAMESGFPQALRVTREEFLEEREKLSKAILANQWRRS